MNLKQREPAKREIGEPGNLESRFRPTAVNSSAGFTLLEVIIALALLGIAITVVLQLFSSNMRSISASEDYVYASLRAEAKMREVLDDDNLSEKSWSEVTDDGYRMDVLITNALNDRTENLSVNIFEVDLILHWTRGTKERSIALRTMKVVDKQI